MKKPDRDQTPSDLDALIDAARADPAKVPDALMARVLADADRVQPIAGTRVQPRPSLWTALSDMFGGWQGLGGLVAATCAGIWIGWSPPSALPDAGALILGYETGEAVNSAAELTSFGWDVEEG